jgi:glutaredoxin
MPKTELFGSSTCAFTGEMREWLEWHGRDFTEYDVEHDPVALARLRAATGGQSTVPVLMEDGNVVQIGWHGRGCFIGGR